MKLFSVALLLKSSLIIKIALSFGFLSIVIFLYGFFYEKNNITLKKIVINRKSLEPELKHIKMIQFSDLHFRTIGAREKKVRKIINEIKPDIIFFTGDFFNSTRELENPTLFNHAIEYLSSLSYKRYFFFVLGEEEYYYRDYIKKRLGNINIRVLDNEIYSMALDSTRLNIIGITNDTKDFDTFYNDDIYHRNNISRFNEFIKQPELKKYQNYTFYIAGQYTFKWENYEISAEVQIPSEDNRLEIAFYSQFPMGINKSYFLEINLDSCMCCINSIRKNDLKGRKCFDVTIKRLNFCQIKINVKNTSRLTRIRAKIWDPNEEEPDQWQIDCYDSRKNKSTRGTIGIHRFDGNFGYSFRKLKVRMLDYDNNSNMLLEGVKEIPFDLNNNEMTQEEWLTLNEINNILDNRQKTNKPYLLEKKFDKIVNKKKLKGFNVLLSHSPSIVRIMKNKGIDLILSGHTHGGQIDIPFIDNYVHDSFEGQLLKSGLKSFSGTQIYINRGIGTSIIPIRINCRPEITLFKFTDQ